MRLLKYFLFVLCFLLMTSLQAALSLKPSEWFKNNELEDLKAFNAATEAEEDEAVALINKGKTKLENGSLRSAERIFKKIIKY